MKEVVIVLGIIALVSSVGWALVDNQSSVKIEKQFENEIKSQVQEKIAEESTQISKNLAQKSCEQNENACVPSYTVYVILIVGVSILPIAILFGKK